ncbi:MAG: hypothetical protein GQ569_15255 [Methylococcaceae bacterium]|nr:hypothetical protein [Methylococcaceae bacterium]
MNFFKRPAHTLLYLSAEKLYRLDSDRKGVLKGEIESFDMACESAGSVPVVVEKFLSKTLNPLGKKIWVLYSRLNSYQLSLPSVQVEGVENDILEQALQFEYEALTGETLTKSQLSYQFINEADEMSNYWITLMATETVNRLMDVLKEFKCSFGGLAHAGGLPYLFSPEDAASWLKLEYWDNSVFALSKTPEAGLSLQIIHPSQNRHWQDEINGWLTETATVDKSEAWVTGRQLEMLPDIQQTIHLSADEDLTLWMGLWLQQLVANDSAGIPLLNKKVNVNKELIYMISSGVAALILCGTHAMWMTYKANDYEFQFEELTKEKTNIDSLKKTLTANQDKIKKLKTDIATLGGSVDVIPEAMAALKQRPAMLLKTLANHSPNDLVIEDIKQVEQHLVVSGVTLQAELSNQLASMIDEPLSKMGWQVSSPTKKSLDLFGKDNGPWAFELIIKDLGLKGFIKTPKT